MRAIEPAPGLFRARLDLGGVSFFSPDTRSIFQGRSDHPRVYQGIVMPPVRRFNEECCFDLCAVSKWTKWQALIPVQQ